MSTNYLNPDCQQLTSEKKFGLFDAEDKTAAKIKLTEEITWNATVVNDKGKSLQFTAIDNCIEVYRENGEMDSRCDCMLIHDSYLLLVELKNKRENWQSEGLAQIGHTAMRMIDENADFYYGFKKRKAIVANRKNKFPAFHESNAAHRQYFFSKYKMRVQFEADIIIE